MSVLSQKLQQASKLFQSHSFKKSLEAYQDCIKFCHRTHQDQSILFNIMSTKATLQYILGEYDEALTTLNSVISKDCCHFLSLLRRSQVYKKKNKLKKALKDLDQIFVFCPDNLQISAFKVQIQHLLLKQGNADELSSESDQQIQEEQEDSLKFMNLKKIDRRSSQMSMPLRVERKSRVTILGDHTFEYKPEQTDQIIEDQTQNYLDKALRTYKQIESDNIIQDVQPTIKVTAPKKAKKSILKNKGTSIFIQSEDVQQKQSKYLGRQSKLINMVKNIDGKAIISSSHTAQTPYKQVQFRKSVSQVPLQQLFVPNEQEQYERGASKITNNSKNVGGSSKRKSCLKSSSFQLKGAVIRRSKFEQIEKLNIDGKFLKNIKRRSIEQGQIDLEKEQNHSDNQASQHNIFGSKGIVLSSDLKLKLGLLQPEPQKKQQKKSQTLKPKQSILKKNSFIFNLKSAPSKQTEQPPQTKTLKSKKSVMFHCTF